jgi:hypothetical protein
MTPIVNTPTIVVTGTGATALVTIVAWILEAGFKIEMPAAVGAAFASLIIVVASWFFPSKPHNGEKHHDSSQN